ncbi:thioredoxin-dependent thiol peroxidase [Allorhizobium terrae]|uniref:thioredoxin-dependent peroxiredoxin n=1 Tax=Allorhizobium terrae TaxID=1848972 RepID=A0A4S4A1J9_9HYPH|nr:thioredoxin-dependent thiol peroxidase [Allorhizobium terrae]THF52214.1 thioredoxin-dependent thiol peroxidase [Allorhizobium terrae]TWD57593.1 peroxiredoxin Q/BCP [Agrobacterium vitis]
MADLAIGQIAPDFMLPRDGGGTVALSSFRGKPVVVYFYPKDNTSGCTVEATAFTALADAFEKANAVVIGISPDSVKSHDKFVAKHNLSIILGSDEEKTTLEAYQVWKEKSMYGKTYMGVERTTYLIDRDGKIAAIWPKVKVPGHAEAVLKAVEELG